MRLNPFIIKKIPSIIFWEFDNKNLLPSEISFEDFLLGDDPYSNSTPLYNIFILSERLGISDADDLIVKVNTWKADSSMRRKDSAIINEDINKYIKSIWEDYDQELNIELEENKITIHINDPNSAIKNYYEMGSRSQGFKVFISFILNIAAEADNETISNFILILDEPETHLHPSGVRFMKNELLKLSEKNYVFYATHSIFMIDRKNLKRHIIIKKTGEETTLKPLERNTILQETVIYEALGTTVDEFSIRNKNIVFEGEMDLILFEAFIQNCLPKKDNNLLEYEIFDGGGTKQINNFFSDKIIPKDSMWLLVLDNDKPGQNLKENILKNNPLLKNNMVFYSYSDKIDFELEDILPQELIKKTVDNVVQVLGIKVVSDFKIESKNISSSVAEFKGRNRILSEKASLFEEKFKEFLINEIKLIIEGILKSGTIEKKNDAF